MIRRNAYRSTVTLFALAVSACCSVSSGADRWQERDRWQNTEAIFDAMAIGEGSVVADVGARDGYLTVKLGQLVKDSGRVYAVDIDQNALDDLRVNLDDERLRNVTTVLGATDDPRLPADTFDAIVVLNSYHEFEAYEAMLAAFRKALKPGGRLVLVEPIAPEMRGKSREEQADEHDIDLAYARADLETAGFDILIARDPFVERSHRDDQMWLLAARKPLSDDS